MMCNKSWAAVALVALASACSGGGETSPDAGAADDGGVTLVPVGVDTVAPASVQAGTTLSVSCLLLDDMGQTFAPPDGVSASLRFVPEDSVQRQDDGSYVATRAGEVEVACTFSSLRLTDDTPSVVQITPGDPARVVTHVAPDSMPADAETLVSCDVYDAYGNPITDTTPSLRAEPPDEANIFDGQYGRFPRAGHYDVYCDLPGAESMPDRLEVYPNVPASLLISRVPDQPVYAQGQVIEIQSLVFDRLGNPVTDAEVTVTSSPAGQQLGAARFRYMADGRYTLTATVTPPTESDIPLTASTEVIVDGNGPTIGCDDPLDGAILDQTPGGTITFRGSVSALAGVTSVSVNGGDVMVDSSGAFSTTLGTKYGINFIDISAVDSAGKENSRTCAFLVADTWAPDDRSFDDTLSLRLRQDAFDDHDRTDGLDSLDDVLSTILNSSGLHDSLDAALSASNPLKPSSCDQGGPFGTCLLRSEVIYRSLQINGPNSAELTLVDGGMQANVHIHDLRVQVRVHGTALGIGYDTTGWITFDSADVGVIFDTGLASARPRVSVRPGSVSVSVGHISTSFSGISGTIIDIVVGLFNGRVRGLVAGALRNYVAGNFNSILDGVVGGLDVRTLGTSFIVPRLDGSGNIRLSFNIGFSSLNTNPTRMLFGIGTRFYAPPAHARPTLGAPSRSGPRILDVSGMSSAAVAVHETLLTQALHGLWRGGFFDATIDSSTVSGAPAGVSAEIATGLPPVVIIRADGRAELSLGAVTMRLTYPALFTDPIEVELGARASMAVALDGDSLTFSDVRIDELYFSTDVAGLAMSTRNTIAGFLQRLIQHIAYSALDGALPAIPIPSFALPDSLSVYGLPSGAALGIVDPTLSAEAPHFVLRGDFAVR